MTSTKTLIIFAHGPSEAVKTHQRYFSGKEGKRAGLTYMVQSVLKRQGDDFPAQCEEIQTMETDQLVVD